MLIERVDGWGRKKGLIDWFGMNEWNERMDKEGWMEGVIYCMVSLSFFFLAGYSTSLVFSDYEERDGGRRRKRLSVWRSIRERRISSSTTT